MQLNDYDEFDLCYDLNKIPDYTLPDPLMLPNGTKIKSVDEWENFRRQELINLFSHNLYGYIPGKFKDFKISGLITKVINLFIKAGKLFTFTSKSGGVKHCDISGSLNIFST